jgi:hypothetical protein
MYFDNLTIAGIVAASLVAFVPLVFGREILRVEDDQSADGSRGSEDPASKQEQKTRSATPNNDATVGDDLLGVR